MYAIVYSIRDPSYPKVPDYLHSVRVSYATRESANAWIDECGAHKYVESGSGEAGHWISEGGDMVSVARVVPVNLDPETKRPVLIAVEH